MRLGVIACEVLARELGAAIAVAESICTVRWLPQGLHDTPALLRTQLQQQIDALEEWSERQPSSRALHAIVLGYGLCGGGTEGLHAGRLPLVLPRNDDCIGILLGSQARYNALFEKLAGVYWLSPGWLERANIPSECYYGEKHAAYTTQFGAENAAWLLEQENAWIARYCTCAYIAPPPEIMSPMGAQATQYEVAARETADFCGWDFLQVDGCDQLLRALVAGDWDARFAVCPSHTQTVRTFDARLIAPASDVRM